jgi:Uma2 family endonuclease
VIRIAQLDHPQGSGHLAAMDTVLERPGSTENFLAWEDMQEFKHEFDGRRVIPMTGGSLAHQRIVLNLCTTLIALLGGKPLVVVQEMRLRIGSRIRYPDVLVCVGPLDQSIKTLTDALVIFEVLSDDTATVDRVDKLIDYGGVASLHAYVLLEQTAMAATLFQRQASGAWIASAHIEGDLVLPGIGITLPLASLYQGLTFAS